MPFEVLPAAAQTAYADLLDSLLSAPPPSRGLTYIKRRSRDREYWYAQQLVGNRKRSFYLGPDNETTRNLVAAARARQEADQTERPAREQVVGIALAAGLWTPTAAELRIYEALAQAGVFAMNGVLVGTHAFLNLGNLLGVRWKREAGRTGDIDVAHDPQFQVAAPANGGDLEAELKKRDPGFLPIPSLDSRQPSTGFSIRGKRLSVSLLTPERGKPSDGPILLPSVRAAAEPVRYLDYLIDNSLLAAVPAGSGILARLPDPARYALHKLVLSQRRPAVMMAKSRKDIDQASVMLEVLLELRPGDIAIAAEAAVQQGPKFVKTLSRAVALVPETIRASVYSLVETGFQP